MCDGKRVFGMVEECKSMNGMGPKATCSVCEAHVGWRSNVNRSRNLDSILQCKNKGTYTCKITDSAGFELVYLLDLGYGESVL